MSRGNEKEKSSQNEDVFAVKILVPFIHQNKKVLRLFSWSMVVDAVGFAYERNSNLGLTSDMLFQEYLGRGNTKDSVLNLKREKRNDLKLIMHQVSVIFAKHVNEILGNRPLFFQECQK